MHLKSSTFFSLVSTGAAFNLPSPKHLFSNPDPATNDCNIPTVHESAVQARRILQLESIGTLSTVFPTTPHSLERRPSDVGGAPIGLMDYYGDCEAGTGNPTILAITIATSFKNVDAGSNITLSLRWHPQDTTWRSPASLPRFSLVGRLEDLSADDLKNNPRVPSCYLKYHPDAVAWLPGNRIHKSKWVRLVVEEVYWIGGFGDRAYIGWIPKEEWNNVTKEEIESIRLPGEKKSWGGWREWVGLGQVEL
ncbi:hypothetical protein ACEQ8H_003848 [Pleosporales sp. CAS-2024a]